MVFCCVPKRRPADPVYVVEIRNVLSRLSSHFPHSHISVFTNNEFLCSYDPGDCPYFTSHVVSTLMGASSQLVTVFKQSGQPHFHLSTETVMFSFLPLLHNHSLIIQQQASFWDAITIDGPEIEARSLPFVQELDLLLESHFNITQKSS
ncbi:hypothetical protein RCL1_002415 [Eukaryota sp. TZLM3-RCL]